MEDGEKRTILGELQNLTLAVQNLTEKIGKLEDTIIPDGDPTKHILVRMQAVEKGVKKIYAIDARFKKLEEKDENEAKEASGKRWQLFLSILPGLGALLWLGLKHS
jgi:hypothetical protein